ncbi:diguanylate cyclase [Thalassotalea ponticola]|uniref:diguanylate cyclase domain-containing protein n=1 Tax=Thalassotalea ponticola TaxID=1523392 RepID=UPI0025B502E1|nr:diguanylate cyclase [Thalassotalea ponticola]MDN3651866.1 diguanylate cyclase [Thalassotalea ponticola]
MLVKYTEQCRFNATNGLLTTGECTRKHTGFSWRLTRLVCNLTLLALTAFVANAALSAPVSPLARSISSASSALDIKQWSHPIELASSEQSTPLLLAPTNKFHNASEHTNLSRLELYSQHRKWLHQANWLWQTQQNITRSLPIYSALSKSPFNDIQVASLVKRVQLSLLSGNSFAGYSALTKLIELNESELTPHQRNDMYSAISFFLLRNGNVDGAKLYQSLLDRALFNQQEQCQKQVFIDLIDMHFSFNDYNQRRIHDLAEHCVALGELSFTTLLVTDAARIFNAHGLTEQALALLKHYKLVIFNQPLKTLHLSYYLQMTEIYQQRQLIDDAKDVADNAWQTIKSMPLLPFTGEYALERLANFAYQHQQYDKALSIQNLYLTTQQDELDIDLQRQRQLSNVMLNINALKIIEQRKANDLLATREEVERQSSLLHHLNSTMLYWGVTFVVIALLSLLVFSRQMHIRQLILQQRNAWTRDPLTKLLSRHYVYQEVAHIDVNDPNQSVHYAGMQLRLQGLRRLNETHGYQKGDELLIQVGKLLAKYTDNKHHIARAGSNEFILVRYDILTASMHGIARAVEQQFYQLLEKLGYSKSDVTLYIGISDSVQSNSSAKYFFTDMNMAVSRAQWPEAKSNIALFSADWTERHTFTRNKGL